MAMGRKKQPKLTKIARGIKCSGEFCEECEHCIERKTKYDQPYLWCKEWERELAPAFNKSKAERCAECHMGERYANGANIFI